MSILYLRQTSIYSYSLPRCASWTNHPGKVSCFFGVGADVVLTQVLPCILAAPSPELQPIDKLQRPNGISVSTLRTGPNAITRINTVLKNLVYEEKDTIVSFNTIYEACEKTF